MKKHILTIDIGGTTFTSSLFDSNLKQLDITTESRICNYKTKTELILAFYDQLVTLYSKNKISIDKIAGLGISAPGPLDSRKGLILETPNLTILQNTNIVQLLESKLKIPVALENDANLFSWGEWYNYYKNKDVTLGITLGSGLGVGIIIGGKIFKGSHGMGAEYGISPVKWGVWEDEISIKGIENISKLEFCKIKSPKELFILAKEKNKTALNIWKNFGYKLGLFCSHLINMIDPAVITFGGGISKAFPYYNNSINETLTKYSPSFNYNSIMIKESRFGKHS